MTACSEDPKAEATAFANRFASYVAQNQLDSIRAVMQKSKKGWLFTIWPVAADTEEY